MSGEGKSGDDGRWREMDVFSEEVGGSLLFHGFFSLPNGCTIFALGISGVITFEEDIQAYSEQRCRVVSVDSVRFLDDKVE